MLAAIDFNGGIEDAWSKIATVVPKLVSFVAILVIGLFVARVLASATRKILTRVGFDRTLERFGIAKHVKRTGMTPTALAGRAVKVILSWVVLTTAFSVFGTDNPVSVFLNKVVNYVPRAVVAVVILGLAAMLAKWAGTAMQRVVDEADVPPVLAKVVPAAVWVLGGFAAVDQLGIAPNTVRSLFNATLAIIAGSAIVAIGGGGIQPMRRIWERSLSKYDRTVDITAAQRAEQPVG